jgi:hypothetical protein
VSYSLSAYSATSQPPTQLRPQPRPRLHLFPFFAISSFFTRTKPVDTSSAAHWVLPSLRGVAAPFDGPLCKVLVELRLSMPILYRTSCKASSTSSYSGAPSPPSPSAASSTFTFSRAPELFTLATSPNSASISKTTRRFATLRCFTSRPSGEGRSEEDTERRKRVNRSETSRSLTRTRRI